MALRKVLTVAGSDTSADAGMQTGLKTLQELDTYDMVALTAIATTDKDTWSHDVTPLPMNVFGKQLETALSIGPDATKTGMLGIEEIIKHAREVYEASNAQHFIVDPVVVCKSEDEVFSPENIEAMIKYLLPKATVVTPDLFEVDQLSGLGKSNSIEDVKRATTIIFNKGVQHVIIKGGKALDQDKSYDLYYDDQAFYQLTIDVFRQSCNHGAGYTFTAATAAYLANGKSPGETVISAGAFVTSTAKNGWKMNDFVGPVGHSAYNHIEHIDVEITEVQRLGGSSINQHY